MTYTRRQAGSIVLGAMLTSSACKARPSPHMIEGVAGQGQSNMVGELDFGQRHRIPDVYDPARDGPPQISWAPASVFTPVGDGVEPLGLHRAVAGSKTYAAGAAETTMFGFCAQLLRNNPERRLCVSVAGAQGASPLSALRRPTRDEIAAGAMLASDRTIILPPNSLEREWLRGAVSLRELWRSPAVAATPWFRDARAQSAAAHHFTQRGQRYAIAYMPMQHGETLPTEPYVDALCAFYDEKQACWHEITGQDTPALLIMELANYAPLHETPGAPGFERWKASGRSDATAPGGASTLYASEADRFNLMFARNLEQVRAVGRGGRRIIVSGPKYPHSSLIHHDQYGARWAGEVMGHHAMRATNGGSGALLGPTQVERRGDKIRLSFDRTVQLRAPANGGTHEIRPGCPYGLGLYAAGGRPVPMPLNVVRVDATGQHIDIGSVPGDVLRVEYLAQARIGSISSTERLPLIAHDRGGGMLTPFDYCCPFAADLAHV